MRLKVATFNVRCGVARDGENDWLRRRGFAGEVIGGMGADVVGLQECYGFQREDLAAGLPGYGWAGVGREDGVGKGEMCAVLWREERWEVEGGTGGTGATGGKGGDGGVGHFWLSEKPGVAGSVSWGSAFSRMATWVRLRERGTGLVWTVVNTHMDHVSGEARERGAGVIVDFLGEVGRGGPVVVLGDFNCEEGEGPHGVFGRAGLVDTWREVRGREEGREGGEGTYHGFKGHTRGPRIDWILRSGEWRTLAVGMETEGRGGRWASDHHLVWAELELR